MKFYLLICIFFVNFFIFSDELSLLNEYNNLLEDMRNIDLAGYKSISPGPLKYNFVQGSIFPTSNSLDFSINGNGFFKVLDEKNKTEYFTRSGSLMISNDGYLMNSEGYKIIPELQINSKKIDKLYFENQKLVYKDGKNIMEYKFKIYLPEINSRIIRNNKYFQFENSYESLDAKLINKSLEMSNTNITTTLIRMIYILNSLDKGESKKIKSIKIKIDLLGKLLNSINQWQVSINQEIIFLDIKKLFAKDSIDEIKSLAMLKRVINDYLPFLEPDYE